LADFIVTDGESLTSTVTKADGSFSLDLGASASGPRTLFVTTNYSSEASDLYGDGNLFFRPKSVSLPTDQGASVGLWKSEVPAVAGRLSGGMEGPAPWVLVELKGASGVVLQRSLTTIGDTYWSFFGPVEDGSYTVAVVESEAFGADTQTVDFSDGLAGEFDDYWSIPFTEAEGPFAHGVLTIKVLDSAYDPVSGQVVVLRSADGSTEVARATTSASGRATFFQVAWAPEGVSYLVRIPGRPDLEVSMDRPSLADTSLIPN